MTKSVPWESRIGRRIRLRDLHILFAVVQSGGMAKAATSLGMSQPAVSETIAGLEHVLGARLLDRSRRGTAPTIYAEALLRRGRAAFDELRQAVSEIETLSDPAKGEVRVACGESITASFLIRVIQEFRKRYSQVNLHVEHIAAPTIIPAVGLPELRERRVDVVLARLGAPFDTAEFQDDDVDVEVLFDDPMVVAVGKPHPLATRRKVRLAELVDYPWILPPPNSLNWRVVAQAFRDSGLPMPQVLLASYSLHLRRALLASEPFVTAYASTNLMFPERQTELKVLPVTLPPHRWPVAVLTLKKQTLRPTVQRFIDCARGLAIEFKAFPRISRG
jgi:DNA-binding transcriptional LysR family regulator